MSQKLDFFIALQCVIVPSEEMSPYFRGNSLRKDVLLSSPQRRRATALLSFNFNQNDGRTRPRCPVCILDEDDYLSPSHRMIDFASRGLLWPDPSGIRFKSSLLRLAFSVPQDFLFLVTTLLRVGCHPFQALSFGFTHFPFTPMARAPCKFRTFLIKPTRRSTIVETI